jgi:hypothetical protein
MLPYYWPSMGTYQKIMSILEEKKFKNLVNMGPLFSMKNPLYRLKSKFSGQDLGKFSPQFF